MNPYSDFVDSGALHPARAQLSNLFRRAATYAGKILKGVKPEDLPVEQPTTFEMVFNLKVPQLLARRSRRPS
jgi:putative tryptophan/tyrosine transport system substrate-binding protein